jgi:hypothetical protein
MQRCVKRWVPFEKAARTVRPRERRCGRGRGSFPKKSVIKNKAEGAGAAVSGPFRSVWRSGRCIVGELPDGTGDPAPGHGAVVIAFGRELVCTRGALLERFLTVTLECHFENYLAVFLNAMWRSRPELRRRSERRSAFPSDNHVVRFGALGTEFPDISRVTAHRSFDGHPDRSPHTLGCVRQIILKILRHLMFKMTARDW